MLGINSLYKLEYHGETFLAKDINTLLEYAKNMNYKITFNELTLTRIIKFGYNNNWDTCFNNITRLKDNFLLGLNNLGSTNSFYSLIENSVKDKLLKTTNNNYGVLFSGGIDSTIILKHLIDHYKYIQVFHLSREEDDSYAYNVIEEWDLAKNLIVIPNLNEEELVVTDEMLLANESTIELGSLAYNYKIFEYIRNHYPNIKYLFTGDGADELFGKYSRNNFYDSRLSDVLDELVFYHIPRLEKTSRYLGLELLTPFLNEDIALKALNTSHEEAKFAKQLKEEYKNYIPKEIIERSKVPLKKNIFNDKESTMLERIKLYNQFKKVYIERYGVS